MSEARMLLEIPARSQYLPVAASFIHSAAEVVGFDPDSVESIEIAVMEAVENVIDHARIGGDDMATLLAWTEGDDLMVEVRDRGVPWPRAVLDGTVGLEMPSADAPRGRGLAMMRALMDRVTPLQEADGTKVLRLIKRRSPVGAAGPGD